MSLAETVGASTADQKQEPHNIELEQAFLGAVLLNNEALSLCASIITREHFYEPIHARIFELAGNIIEAGKVANPVTMKSYLEDDLRIGNLNAGQYLVALSVNATTVINAPFYAQELKALADRRRSLKIAEALQAELSEADETKSVSEIVDRAIEEFHEAVVPSDRKRGFIRFKDAALESIDRASAAYQQNGSITGLETGLMDLDILLGGLQKSDLIILAGRPGMGKTALAANVAHRVSREYRGQPTPDGCIKTVSGGVVGFFSLEMSAEQLATRILSERTEVPSSSIRRGGITEDDFTKLAQSASDCSTLPLFIDDTAGQTIAAVSSRARRLKRTRGLDLLCVDYLQLLNGTKRKGGARVEEVGEITTGLKSLAKELNIPVLALAQLSRQVENREDKRPQLSDLRESGSIEQDADVVIFVYREEYYLKNREPREGTEAWFKWEADMKAAENVAELIVGKHRHGACGTISTVFDARLTRFSNRAREEYYPSARVAAE